MEEQRPKDKEEAPRDKAGKLSLIRTRTYYKTSVILMRETGTEIENLTIGAEQRA